MRFSVVIPTCNRPDMLAACLGRLAPGRTTFAAADYEVVVTDDGVRPSAEKLIAETFPWAKWSRGPRRGIAANRNAGAALARGEWIAFLDDDCLPEPGWLEAYARAAQHQPELAVLEGRTISGVERMGALEIAPVNETGGMLWSCNLAIRADTFRQVGGFDEELGSNLEDVDLRLRLKHAGAETLFVSAAAVVHPPRPLRPLLRQVREHRTYFQFARKHGITVRAAGLNWRAYLVWRYQILRRSRNVGEAARFAGRSLAEAILILPLCFWWALSVRPRK